MDMENCMYQILELKCFLPITSEKLFQQLSLTSVPTGSGLLLRPKINHFPLSKINEPNIPHALSPKPSHSQPITYFMSQDESGLSSRISCDYLKQEPSGVYVGWPVILGCLEMYRPCTSLPLDTL